MCEVCSAVEVKGIEDCIAYRFDRATNLLGSLHVHM
jgi:hypothetical protein